MNVDNLRLSVFEYFSECPDSFGLDRATLSVEYVLNWGGFVNHSFRVLDARTAFHVKLSTSVDDQSKLRRWMKIAPLLTRYHAPSVLSWIDVGPAAGLLFPHLQGAPPALDVQVLIEVGHALQSLNADQELAAALGTAEGETARTEYMNSLHRRFIEDLRGIRESPPPFVGQDLLRWMEDEAGELSHEIASVSAFEEPLTKPVHGDLWLNNILWVSPGEWHIVDWDDVRNGDPAADLAALVGPSADDLRPLKMLEHVEGLLTALERERLPYLGRATLLDWVIDPLSDWIDATSAPEHEQVVRQEKERVHREALEMYRSMNR